MEANEGAPEEEAMDQTAGDAGNQAGGDTAEGQAGGDVGAGTSEARPFTAASGPDEDLDIFDDTGGASSLNEDDPGGLSSMTHSPSLPGVSPEPSHHSAEQEQEEEEEEGTFLSVSMPRMVEEGADVLGEGPRVPEGTRTKTTTPTSQITDVTKDERSRELVYHRAMSLMSARCRSSQGDNARTETPLVCYKNPPLGRPFLQLFYVQQSRPLPLPPLKAWRGFHGNVYFEPIQINSMAGLKSTSSVVASSPPSRSPGLERAKTGLSGATLSPLPHLPLSPHHEVEWQRAPVGNTLGSLRVSSRGAKSRTGAVKWRPADVKKGSVVRENMGSMANRLPALAHAKQSSHRSLVTNVSPRVAVVPSTMTTRLR